jgi:hypothetical protein
VSKTSWSSPLEWTKGVKAMDIADRTGGHSRKPIFGFSMSAKESIGGVVAVDSGGQAGIGAERVGEECTGHIVAA